MPLQPFVKMGFVRFIHIFLVMLCNFYLSPKWLVPFSLSTWLLHLPSLFAILDR